MVWTAEAQRWLQEIYDYIAEDNEPAAYRTVRGIHVRAEILLTSRDRLSLPRAPRHTGAALRPLSDRLPPHA